MDATPGVASPPCGHLPVAYRVLGAALVVAASAGCGARGDSPVEPSSDAGLEAGPPPPDFGVPLPFVLDDHFHPSGCYSGDGCPVDVDTSTCAHPTPRPAGAQGQCYRFEYFGEQPWGGVFFQNADELGAANWGQAPGVLIAPGARQVSFYAASEPPGQLIKFKVGGISDPELEYRDTLDLEVSATLTGELLPYTISLEGSSYDYVLSGLSWHFERADATGSVFLLLDDLRWE